MRRDSHEELRLCRGKAERSRWVACALPEGGAQRQSRSVCGAVGAGKNSFLRRSGEYLWWTNWYRREVDERLPNQEQCRPYGPCRPRGICCLVAGHFFVRGNRQVWRSG